MEKPIVTKEAQFAANMRRKNKNEERLTKAEEDYLMEERIQNRKDDNPTYGH